MSIQDINELNRNFYMGGLHLFEAGKYLSNVDKNFANELFEQSQKIISAVKIPKEKISDQELDDVLNKIMAFDLNKHEQLKNIETGLNLANE